ncbi:MAG: FAD-dependent monooxygenase [Oscillatoriaceae cyanobacterium Prado104]|jgi:salicylate hydroxylase|nr:FAD-dependent monooxygenase [Oscillatoriaceae cyanobacterium Prado104]
MTMREQNPIRIVVVGAGVAGCLIVQGLHKHPGVEIFCIEKGPEVHSLTGTALNIGPNALKILKQVNPVMAATLLAKEISLPWLSWKAGLTDGTLLMDLSFQQVADNPGMRIRWSELYNQLRSPIAEKILYNTTITSMGYADFPDRGLLKLDVENQHTGECQTFDGIDLIVGSDGCNSQVRSTFFSRHSQPSHLGVCIYRLIAPNRADNPIDDYQQWFHNGCRLLTYAIPGNEIYITGTFPLDSSLIISDKYKQPHTLQQLYKPERGYSELCQFLVDSICDRIDIIHWARMQELPPVFGDDRGHVICVGDSSHAMIPTLGQGATQAIEDGCFFVALFHHFLNEAKTNKSRVNIPNFLKAIEAKRRSRIEFVQQFSREASDSLLAGSNPIPELKAKTQAPFLEKLAKMYRDTPKVLNESATLYLN